MPLSKTGKSVLKKMRKHYGSERGESVFYATINAGKLKGMEKKSKKKK